MRTKKWTTAAAVLLVLVAPVPALAGVVASGLAVIHALPWMFRAYASSPASQALLH